MELEGGDIQFVSNHAVIHARRGYEDDPDPQRRRHLLRLWLSLPTPRTLAARTRKASAAARTLAAFTAARWRGLDA